MPNPIFQVLGGGNSQSNMMQQFQQFMNQMKGKDPNAMINELVSQWQTHPIPTGCSPETGSANARDVRGDAGDVWEINIIKIPAGF